MTKDLSVYRRLLAVAGITYLVWWFAVELFLPGSFNPVASRLVVVGTILGILVASYFSDWIREHVRLLFGAGAWLLTLHYFYLFYGNGGTMNWIVGCFITVIAVNFCFLSNTALVAYSLYTLWLSLGILYLLPELRHSVFFPGLFTIVLQANLGLRSRLRLIKILAESNARFQLLFNSTFEGILVHENGIILNVNESLASMMDVEPKAIIGKNALDIIHPDEREAVASKMKLDDTSPYETKGINRKGEVVEIEVRARNFKYGKDRARLVTIQQISDRKRAEKAAVTALAMTENVRVRDEFISIASHELKTPLTSLKLQAQILERDIRKNPISSFSHEKLEEIVALFSRQTNRLTELVDAMLDVSRISSGRLKLEKQKIDLPALVRHTAETIKLHHPQPDWQITVEAPDHLEIDADPVRLEQVVENLLTNALKYGEGNPVRVKVEPETGNALITVEDQGMGIAPEFKPRIFERFERATSSRNIAGLGLGLYITRQIVDAHGGSIIVESRLGMGSTFQVRLPLH